jgi:CRISPR-associated protein Csm4
MKTLRYTLRPLTALGTPLVGDTLFGQLCWTLRHQLGNQHLQELLAGYTNGQPFAVVSDPMPSGYLPLPTLPSSVWVTDDHTDHKQLKKRRWLASASLTQPLPQWQALAKTSAELAALREQPQPHNSINRQSASTGTGAFAPYSSLQYWYEPGVSLDLYVVLDPQRLSQQQLDAALAYIGHAGYGRDASIGLGKFSLEATATLEPWPFPATANSYLTLGPCAPQGLDFSSEHSYWQVVTRFGRHGDAAVHGASPFKKPVLLAQTGAVFRPQKIDPQQNMIGQGLGGVQAPISSTLQATVHQGYAPVIPIDCPEVAP